MIVRAPVGVSPCGIFPTFRSCVCFTVNRHLHIFCTYHGRKDAVGHWRGQGQLLRKTRLAEELLISSDSCVPIQPRSASQRGKPGLVPDGKKLPLIPRVGIIGRLGDADDKLRSTDSHAVEIEFLPNKIAPTFERPVIGMLYVILKRCRNRFSFFVEWFSPALPM